jgi:hypothetical protein
MAQDVRFKWRDHDPKTFGCVVDGTPDSVRQQTIKAPSLSGLTTGTYATLSQ